MVSDVCYLLLQKSTKHALHSFDLNSPNYHHHLAVTVTTTLPECPSSHQHMNSYVNLRTWRVFTLASPECGVPPTSTPFGDDYPFSMKVPATRKLTLKDIMAIQVCILLSSATKTHALLWLRLAISLLPTILDGYIGHADTSPPSSASSTPSTTPSALSHITHSPSCLFSTH